MKKVVVVMVLIVALFQTIVWAGPVTDKIKELVDSEIRSNSQNWMFDKYQGGVTINSAKTIDEENEIVVTGTFKYLNALDALCTLQYDAKVKVVLDDMSLIYIKWTEADGRNITIRP